MGEKLCFGLPGNPCSAHVTFTLLVRPALLMLRGLPQARAQLPVRARVRPATDTHWERFRERRFVRSLRAEVLEAKLLDDVQSDPVRPEFARALERTLVGLPQPTPAPPTFEVSLFHCACLPFTFTCVQSSFTFHPSPSACDVDRFNTSVSAS